MSRPIGIKNKVSKGLSSKCSVNVAISQELMDLVDEIASIKRWPRAEVGRAAFELYVQTELGKK